MTRVHGRDMDRIFDHPFGAHLACGALGIIRSC